MSEDSSAVRWGIIGPGRIARSFAAGVARSRTGKLVAIGTRDPGRSGLAEDFAGARVVEAYQALIDDPEVEAVYVSTPHPHHAEWAIKAAEGGKHVLCEKPMALSAWEADAMFHAARKSGTFMAEAYMYRLHPQTRALIDLVASGAIGEVRMIRSSFGFEHASTDPTHRLFVNDLAGGGILDVGGYPVSMARLIAAVAAGKPFLDPDKVTGVAHLGQTGVDEWASAVLRFPGGIVADVSCSVAVRQDNVLRIFGTTGRIEVADFWFGGGREGGIGKIEIVRHGGTSETVAVDEPRHLWTFEADAVGEAIRAGRQELAPPGMGWADTLGNMRVLDRWRRDAGLVYDIEKPARRTKTLAGRPLVRGNSLIETRQVPGVPRPTSLLALGFEFFPHVQSASILLDAFFERGGNLFDTAWVYGLGRTEAVFGDWHTSRGLKRDEIVVIGKGAHSPLCYPDVIARQLTESLDRLKVDYLDVYFMHRDNPDVPVGEFVDAMDAEVKAGRIRGPFGGSNWTRERMEAAIAYADANGKQRPGALSNNFALAEMLDPIWPGCISCSSGAWKAWLTERQMPTFAWSSQGRGFFTDRAGRDKRNDEELVRVWYSEANFERRDRAIALAEKLGRAPIHVALAYVIAQPFPVVPLIGPRTLDELEDSLSALDIKLSSDDIAWLAGD